MSQMMTLVLTTPGAAVGFVALAIGLLEVERRWTVACRRRDRNPGLVAYPLDTLALIALICAMANVVGTVAPVIATFTTSLQATPIAMPENAAPSIIGGSLILALLLVFVIWRRMRRRTLAAANQAGVDAAPDQHGSMANAQTTAQWNPAEAATLMPVRHGGRITAMVPAPPTSFLDLPIPPAPPAPIEVQRNVRQIGFVAFLSLGLAATAIALVIGSNVQFQQQTGTFMADLRAQIARQAEQTTLFSNIIRESNQPATVIINNIAPTPLPEATQSQLTLEHKRVNGDVLNLRAAPGSGQPILARLQRGTEVELIGDSVVLEDATWVRIRIGAAEGWVSSAFLE